MLSSERCRLCNVTAKREKESPFQEDSAWAGRTTTVSSGWSMMEEEQVGTPLLLSFDQPMSSKREALLLLLLLPRAVKETGSRFFLCFGHQRHFTTTPWSVKGYRQPNDRWMNACRHQDLQRIKLMLQRINTMKADWHTSEKPKKVLLFFSLCHTKIWAWYDHKENWWYSASAFMIIVSILIFDLTRWNWYDRSIFRVLLHPNAFFLWKKKCFLSSQTIHWWMENMQFPRCAGCE